MSREIYDVVVVGGGPVGMGLAIELGQRGARVAVVERFATPQPIPKGQNLTQRTMENLHFWGCEAEVRARRPAPKDVGIGGVTCYGQLLTDYWYDWFNRSSVNDFYYVANERLPQYETEAALRARAAEIDAIDIRYGWSFVGLVERADGVVVRAERFPNPGDGDPLEIEARYVVGCDGSRSGVRAAAGITETLSDHDRLMALLVFQSTELHQLLERFPGKAIYNVLRADLDGYWLFFGRVTHGASWFFHAPVPMGTTKDNFDFAAYLHQVVGRPFALEFDYIGFWDLRIAIADRYGEGRVFIAGDAAHSHPPYGGYGINTGFEDARNLGWKLAAALQGWGGPKLLGSYDAERRPVFASTARDFIETFIEKDREFLRTYSPERDRAAFEAAWFSRDEADAAVSEFEPHYEGSPLVFGPAGGVSSAKGAHAFSARAGHHLPPQTLPTGESVFERLGSGFTLIALDAATAEIDAFRAAAERSRTPLDIVADAGAAAAREAYGARLILARPDHYVAWAGDALDQDAAAILDRARGA